jgi:hypothetical protein
MEIGNDMILSEEKIESVPHFYEFIKHSYFSNMVALKSYRHLPFEMKKQLLNNKAEYIIKNCNILRIQDMKNPNVIYGFSAYVKNGHSLIVYFMYVKKPFRGIGLAKKLIQQMGQGCDTFEYAILKDLRKFSIFRDFRLNKSML